LADTRISNLASGGAVAANDRFVAVETPGVGPVIKTGAQLQTWAASTVSDPLNLAQYNGATDCTAALQAALDYCFGPSTAPHAASGATSNKSFVLPPGTYNITAPLNVTKVRGGLIKGAGRFATKIINTAGGGVFRTNGFEYSRVEGMYISGSGSSTELFMLDWDNSSGPALQSNTFSDLYFEGGGYGLTIGDSGYMGSENLFLNCFFSGNASAGLSTWNFNALQNTIIGGNFQSCGVGIQVYQGSAPNIIGVGFQGNTQDIQVDNTANDTYSLIGCRTESSNFFKSVQPIKVVLSGCTQLSSASGNFVYCNGSVCMDACHSQNGQLLGTSPSQWNLRNNDWGRADYIIDNGADGFSIGALIEDGNVRSTTGYWGADFTLSSTYFTPLGGF
jgi:hypothetical protein